MRNLFKLEAVLFVLLAIVAVAFFPAIRGPYSATHGPATTLRTRWLNVVEKFKSTPDHQRGTIRATLIYSCLFLVSLLVVAPAESTSSCVLRI